MSQHTGRQKYDRLPFLAEKNGHVHSGLAIS